MADRTPFPRRLVEYELHYHRKHTRMVQGQVVCAIGMVLLIGYGLATDLHPSTLTWALLFAGMFGISLVFWIVSSALIKTMRHHNATWCAHCLAEEGHRPALLPILHRLNGDQGWKKVKILLITGVAIAVLALLNTLFFTPSWSVVSLLGASLCVVTCALSSMSSRFHPRWRTHCSLCPDYVREQASLEVHQARAQVT